MYIYASYKFFRDELCLYNNDKIVSIVGIVTFFQIVFLDFRVTSGWHILSLDSLRFYLKTCLMQLATSNPNA